MLGTKKIEMFAFVGLEDQEKSPIAKLLGGQKKIVAITRALAVSSNIFFLL